MCKFMIIYIGAFALDRHYPEIRNNNNQPNFRPTIRGQTDRLIQSELRNTIGLFA